MAKRRVILWRGYHGKEIESLISEQLSQNQNCLILFSPTVFDFSFLKYFGGYEVCFAGDWTSQLKQDALSIKKTGTPFEGKKLPAFGIFSTGTLEQKLVLFTRQNIESSLDGILKFFEKEKIQSIFCYPQPFHIFGLALGYVHAALKYKRLIYTAGPYGKSAHLARVDQYEFKMMTLGTPTHFDDLMKYQASFEKKMNASYTSIIGGAAVTCDHWRGHQKLLNIENPSVGYGATEASPGVTHLPPGVQPEHDYEVGFALGNIEFSSHPEKGVHVVGKSVCLAVIEFGQIEFLNELWIRDLLRQTKTGSWVYEGRLDCILNRGGEKFSLERIEKDIVSLTKRNAVCLAVVDVRLGFELAVVFEGPIDHAVYGKLESHLLHKYGREFLRSYFRYVKNFPINSSGKVDRTKIHKEFSMYEH